MGTGETCTNNGFHVLIHVNRCEARTVYRL
jgi:hypothetical protein